MRIADLTIRLHHRKGTPALASTFHPHSLSLRSWRFFGVCVCFFLFFFLVRKVRDTARKLNRGRGSISTSAQHWCCSDSDKRPATQATSSPYWKARRPWGRGWLCKLQHKPTALARRSAMRNAGINAGTVSLGGATLGPVPSLLPLNRSFSVACRPMSGLKNSTFL